MTAILQNFDYKLFLLVILLAMWLASGLKQVSFGAALSEVSIGALVGTSLGLLWNTYFYPGVLTLGALTVAVTLWLSAERKLARLLAIGAGVIAALVIYNFYWGTMDGLWQMLSEDFR